MSGDREILKNHHCDYNITSGVACIVVFLSLYHEKFELNVGLYCRQRCFLMSLSTASVSLFTLVYRLCRLSVGDCVSVLSTVKRLGVSFTFHRLFILLRISKNKEMINVCKKRLTVNQEIGQKYNSKVSHAITNH